MGKTLITLCTLLLSAVPVFGLEPFVSDGCSRFPDGTWWDSELWLECCVGHDRAYWLGGTYEQRLEADKELRDCVAGVGEPVIAELMLGGVRAGGTPFLPTSYRWGYGWAFPRGYQTLTAEERKIAEEMMGEENGQ